MGALMTTISLTGASCCSLLAGWRGREDTLTDVLNGCSAEDIFAVSEILNLNTLNSVVNASRRCSASANSNPSFGYRWIVADSVMFSPCSNCCRKFVVNCPWYTYIFVF